MKEKDPFTAPSAQELPEFLTSLELKEIFSMLAEMAAGEQVVLNTIELAMREPAPLEEDAYAVEEFNSKMLMLEEMAKEYIRRADLLKEIRDRIHNKIIPAPRD